MLAPPCAQRSTMLHGDEVWLACEPAVCPTTVDFHAQQRDGRQVEARASSHTMAKVDYIYACLRTTINTVACDSALLALLVREFLLNFHFQAGTKCLRSPRSELPM